MRGAANSRGKPNCDHSDSTDHSTTAGITKSASLAKAERRIQTLEAENKKLREDFAEMSSMYHQLVGENKHERFDERRMMALKSIIIQLERQVISLNEALGSRTATLMEIENALSHIAEHLRVHSAKDNALGAKVGSVPVPNADLTSIIETAESARIKLYKNIERTNSEKLEKSLLMMNKFIKPTPSDPITLLDICSGRLGHLNLKEVSKLESELAQLYRQLMLVNTSLSSVVLTPDKNKPANCEVPAVVYEKLGGEISRASNLLKSANSSLLDLTLLLPAAPWPPLQRPHFAELTTDNVIKSMPSFPRSKASEGRQMVEALLKCFMYEKHMHKLQNQILTDDLNFHQNVYDLQQDYIQTLFTAVKEGYDQFEESTNDLICQPLSAVLTRYSQLKDTASEESLREFLSVFKQYADQLQEAVDVLQRGKGEGGGVVLSQFGDQFLTSLDKLHQGCRSKRDNALSELEDIKKIRQDSLDALTLMFTPEKNDPDDNQECENIAKTMSSLNVSDVLETPIKEKSNALKGRSRPTCETPLHANGRRRKSVGPSRLKDSEYCSGTEDDCSQEPNIEAESRGTTPAKDMPQSRKVAKRPTSFGRMGSNLDSSRLASPKSSHLPPPSGTSQSSGPQGGDGSKGSTHQNVRASLIPGPSPTHTPKSRLLPGGRLTPIHKLKLKPKHGGDSHETPPSQKSEPESDT